MYVPMIELMLVHPSARILVLAAIGLAALVMIHVLAQDFNRIRKPQGKYFSSGMIFKRDTAAQMHRLPKAMELAVSSIF